MVIEQYRVDSIRAAEIEYDKRVPIKLFAAHVDKTGEDSRSVSW